MSALQASKAPAGQSLARLRPWAFSVLVGLAVMAAASLVAAPGRTPASVMGRLNVALAADPFSTEPNAMATRFLTPLVAWLLGLRGEGLLFFIAALCVLLPTLAARWALGRGFGPSGAWLAGGALGLTLLTRTSWHYGGMTDVVTYLLVFGVWWQRSRPAPVGLFLALALFNNERVLFLWPYVVWLLLQGGVTRRSALAACLLPVLLWLPVFLLIPTVREVEHSAGYYLSPLLRDPLTNLKQAWPWQGLGFASAFQWLWLLPVWYVRQLNRVGARVPWPALLLPVICAAGQMLVAFDSSRLAALAFPCLLPPLMHGLQEGGPAFRRNLAVLLALQAVTPQIFTAAGLVEFPRGWLWP